MIEKLQNGQLLSILSLGCEKKRFENQEISPKAKFFRLGEWPKKLEKFGIAVGFVKISAFQF